MISSSQMRWLDCSVRPVSRLAMTALSYHMANAVSSIPMLLRLVPEFRRAMDLSLVLDQEGVPHQLRSLGDEQCALAILDDDDAARAESAVSAFEHENPIVQRPDREAPPTQACLARGNIFR